MKLTPLIGLPERHRRRVAMAMLTVVSAVALAALLAAPAETAPARVIHVDDSAVAGGNGTARSPYTSLADALADAKMMSTPVVIKVAPGDYAIDSPLVVDRPLELRGSSVLTDDADGWPTGEVAAGTETRVFSTNSNLTRLMLFRRDDGGVLSDVSISGFVLQGTTRGPTVLLTRVQKYWVADNVFLAPAMLGVQSVASSGRVSGNYFRGVGTGALFNGGYTASPSNVLVTGNRSVQNTLGGVLLNGASIDIPELGDELRRHRRDNDLRGTRARHRASGCVSSSSGEISARRETRSLLRASAPSCRTTESTEIGSES